MSDHRDRIGQLRNQAAQLPHGPTQVALLEEAVQLADALNDIDLAYNTRFDLCEAANFSGRQDLLLVAFSWCLAQYDKYPDRFDTHDLLWKYKWVVMSAADFPEVNRMQLEEMLDDLERRYRATGSTLHALYQKRRYLMVTFGDLKAANAAHAIFRKRQRDEHSDCPACVASDTCNYQVFRRAWRLALRSADVVLKGELSCAEEPHGTLSSVLLPLLRLGQVDKAKALQRSGYRLIQRASHFLDQQAQQLTFVTLIGDFAQAKRMLERHLPDVLVSLNTAGRFRFLLASRLLMDRLADSGVHVLKVRLPQGMPKPDAKGRSDIRTLGTWFTGEAQEIAGRFDRRNGNDYFQRQIDDLPKP